MTVLLEDNRRPTIIGPTGPDRSLGAGDGISLKGMGVVTVSLPRAGYPWQVIV